MRPDEKVCEGCIHGDDCRVIPCADCGKDWHHLGLVPNPFICTKCDVPA